MSEVINFEFETKGVWCEAEVSVSKVDADQSLPEALQEGVEESEVIVLHLTAEGYSDPYNTLGLTKKDIVREFNMWLQFQDMIGEL